MLKKYMIFAFFLGFFVAEGFSETVAFACFQNKDAHESAKNLTGLFEDFLFEPFFDNGFVVTNVPVQEVPENSKFDLVSVKNLFAEPVDYIVVLSFEYGASAVLEKKTGKKAPDWKGLTVSLVRFTDGEIFKKTLTPASVSAVGIEKKAALLSEAVASELLFAIKKDRKF